MNKYINASKTRASVIQIALQVRVSLREGVCERRSSMPISTNNAVKTIAKNVIQTQNGYSIAVINRIRLAALDRSLYYFYDAAEAIGIQLCKVVQAVAVNIQDTKNVSGPIKDR